MSSPTSRVHVDRGGTFTDIVAIAPDGVAHVAKVPSDKAVIGALVPPEAALTFGTTVATNALLERRGVPTLLVVSPGFEDLIHLRDMARPDLFDPDREHPATLATGVMSPQRALAADLSPYAAIAIVLLGGYQDPDPELALADALIARAGHAYLALGHRVSREPGYLARIETTLVDAAITPLLHRAIAADRVPPGALAMRSDGSLAPAPELRAHEAVLSGPAGGVLATLRTARDAGFSRAVGLDMGGTSTDVCLVDVDAGLPLREGDLEVAGVRLRRSMLEVETIAAGGGSILARTAVGLAVGPRSAGADPGPQCYGRGGPPTLTDAALAAGLIDARAFPLPLDPGAVALPAPAESFLAIARESMAQAVRRLAMARGADLAGHVLVAYGGAGGQHAAPVAELLGIDTVLVHPAASVFCAYGQSLARRSEELRTSLVGPLEALVGSLAARLTALAAGLPRGATWDEPERFVAIGHLGTDHPLEIRVAGAPTLASLRTAFESAYIQRYGFSRVLPLEVFALTVRVHAREPEVPHFGGDPFALGDEVLSGPRVPHAATTSVLVPVGWRARSERGILRLDRTRATSPEPAAAPALLELWRNRLRAIASESGVVLARLARSVSIKERHDFSCAIFDHDGRLITNAPHIPVHLGAMGETVRDLLRALAERGVTPHDGDAWLTNDPLAGGSHLPDLTVITLVRSGPRRFFVASRGHHVDVGGIAPGSMPVASRTLADEGLSFVRVPLIAKGLLTDLAALVAGSRQPAVVAADLEAQLAANAYMARRLRAFDPEELARQMARLHEHARGVTERLVAALPETTHRAADDLDGIPIEVAISRRDGRLVVDFSGTGGPHHGNLNAPPAVVRAAVLYALRLVLGEDDLPLSDGTLASVEIITPHPSLLSPPEGAAVVGGNVETSQRLVDLILMALGQRAASAGTMNNLVIGRAPDDPDSSEWAFYETLGGGFGATPHAHGLSARQLHMTNTRATDPEVLALRLPLAVRRFAIRHGSGGRGRHAGGDGLVRELEVTRPAIASLIAAWRPGGAPGLAGGGPGATGRAFAVRAGVEAPWHGEPIALAPGDRVIVETPGGGAWGPPES